MKPLKTPGILARFRAGQDTKRRPPFPLRQALQRVCRCPGDRRLGICQQEQRSTISNQSFEHEPSREDHEWIIG